MATSAPNGVVEAGPWATQWVITSLNSPVFVSFGVSSILHGLFLGRSLHVWRGSHIHSGRYKIFLGIVSVLLAAYAALIFEETCAWGVSQQRSFEDVVQGTAPATALPVLGAIISCLCQVALARRASALFKTPFRRWLFLGFIGLGIAAEFVGGLLNTYTALQWYVSGMDALSSIPNFTNTKAITMCLLATAIVDIAISAALYFNLRALSKKNDGFNLATDSIIRKAIHVALRTASYTTLLALFGVGLSLGVPELALRLTNIVYVTFIPLPGLHALALFSTVTSTARQEDHGTLPVLSVNGFDLPRAVLPNPSPRPLRNPRRDWLDDDDDDEDELEDQDEGEGDGGQKTVELV